MIFVHVGSFVELPNGKQLNNFGETIDLPQQDGDAMIADDAPLLPASVFSGAGFTADELKKYPNIPMHELGGPSVVAKRKKAWELLHEYRESLKAPVPDAPLDHDVPADHGEKEGE